MITGDAPYTACHVARELRFTSTKHTLILTNDDADTWSWISVDQTIRKSLDDQVAMKYDLCLTGEGLLHLHSSNQHLFRRILPHVRIFARVAPKQKELVITSLRSLGFTTLMCGDGTNDVGALKHANVGKCC